MTAATGWGGVPWGWPSTEQVLDALLKAVANLCDEFAELFARLAMKARRGR